MRLLLFSDLHLDAAFAWAGSGGPAARKRRDALRSTLNRILDLAVDESVDAVLCGGDLYEHERFSADTEDFLYKAFAKLGEIRVFVSPGNHDFYGPESIYSRIKWTPNVHIFKDEHLEPMPLEDGVTLWGAAHLAPAGTRGFLDGFKVDRGGINLSLFHGSEISFLAQQGGEKKAHAPFRSDDINRAGLNHAFLGHYHVPRDENNHTYPGNPDPLSFGEQGIRGPVIIDVFADGSIDRTRFSLAATTSHDLTVDLTGCSNRHEVRQLVSARISDLVGVARITLEGELSEQVDLQPADITSLDSSLDGMVVRIGRLEPAYDFELISREPSVRGRFVRDVLESDLDAEARRRVLVTGLRALSGRADLEVI